MTDNPAAPVTAAGTSFIEWWHDEGLCDPYANWPEVEQRIAAIEAEAAAPAERIREHPEWIHRAMKEAHGRRVAVTETYPEAVARRYFAILDKEAAR